MTACRVAGCRGRVAARGLCATHYQQQRRKTHIRDPRTPRGEGDRVVVRLPKAIRAAIQAAAEVVGVTEAQWIREAALLRLSDESWDLKP